MNQSEKILTEIEKLAEKQFLPIVGSEKGKILERFVKKRKPKIVLEIGTLVGYSAIRIARNLEEDAKLICVEVNARLAEIAKENISNAGLNNVKIIVGDGKKVVGTLKNKFDLVFIDALKEEYLDYLKAVEDKLSEKAVIVADNAGVFAQQMEDYLDYVKNSGKYRSKTYQVYGDAMEVSVKV